MTRFMKWNSPRAYASSASLNLSGSFPDLRSADVIEIDKQTMAIGREPLPSPLGLGTEAPDHKPELLGMVRKSEMHRFMSD